MESYLFVDTETTGFKKSGSFVQKGQARVYQLALVLTDGQGYILNQFCGLIRPDNWKIHKGAFAVHGISDEDCERFGVHYPRAIQLYYDMGSSCTQIVAHNEDFDRSMMDIERAYHSLSFPPTASEIITISKPWYCTMKNNTHIKNGKWPSLADTYKHYTGKDIDGAHDALVDTLACRDIFFAMRGIKL